MNIRLAVFIHKYFGIELFFHFKVLFALLKRPSWSTLIIGICAFVRLKFRRKFSSTNGNFF